MEEAIAILLILGWKPDGETNRDSVRIPTTRSPIYGGIGGEVRTFGGRKRYALPGTNRKVTVGKITVNFYQVIDKKPTNFRQVKTNNLAGLRELAKKE